MIKRMSLKTKLLIYEYKERYPSITAEHVAQMFNIQLETVERLFEQGEIIVPSRFNKK